MATRFQVVPLVANSLMSAITTLNRNYYPNLDAEAKLVLRVTLIRNSVGNKKIFQLLNTYELLLIV